MTVKEMLEKKSVTKYRLSQNSGVPYSKVCDICSGRTRIENCSAGAVYRIARELGVSVESLLEPQEEERDSGENPGAA